MSWLVQVSCGRHSNPSFYTTGASYKQVIDGSGVLSHTVMIVSKLYINVHGPDSVVRTRGRVEQLQTCGLAKQFQTRGRTKRFQTRER